MYKILWRTRCPDYDKINWLPKGLSAQFGLEQQRVRRNCFDEWAAQDTQSTWSQHNIPNTVIHEKARKWKREYSTIVAKLLEKGPCSLAAAPSLRPVGFASLPATTNQMHKPIHIVFRQTAPFLHAMDKCSRWSELGKLKTRRLCDHIDTLTRVQLFKQGISQSIQADWEYS